MINALINGFEFIDQQREIHSEMKQRAIAEYKAALKMPRKKKKIAKKNALLLWSVADCAENMFTY